MYIGSAELAAGSILVKQDLFRYSSFERKTALGWNEGFAASSQDALSAMSRPICEAVNPGHCHLPTNEPDHGLPHGGALKLHPSTPAFSRRQVPVEVKGVCNGPRSASPPRRSTE